MRRDIFDFYFGNEQYCLGNEQNSKNTSLIGNASERGPKNCKTEVESEHAPRCSVP